MVKNKKNEAALAEVAAKLEKMVCDGNKAIAEGTLSADFAAGFAVLEKEYADLQARMVYDELAKEPNPVIAAIKRYSYTVIKHKEVKDTDSKKIAELSIVEKEKQIDLLKFCTYAKLDTFWQFAASKLNQLLCLRAAKELHFTASEIAKIAKSYYLREKAREIKMGKTPASNNALCKAVQRVIDTLLPPELDKQNIYKCNNHDVAYLLMCYTKKGRSALSIAVAKDSSIRNLIMDICHRIIEGKQYTLEYTMVKEKTKTPMPIAVPVIVPEVMPQVDLMAELNFEFDWNEQFEEPELALAA